MNTILLGNAIALMGSVVMIGIGFLRKKEQILWAQCLQCTLMGIGNLVLGGITGFFTNIITIIRNLVSCKIEFTPKIKILFIIIQVIPALFINTRGIIGMLPILAACIFTWYMDTKNEVLFKTVIIITQVMWTIYDITILNYVAFAFDLLTIASNSITLFKMRRGTI